MRIMRWIATLLALLTFASPAAAQPADPAGRWALRADGRVLALLDLRHDATASGGWTGEWIRPDHMTINQTHIAFAISGPIVRRPILAATARDGRLELTIAARTPNEEPDVYTFRVMSAGRAEMAWRDFPVMPALSLVRSEAGVAVVGGWDSAAEYLLEEAAVRTTNPEMTAIFEADQADRRAGPGIDWAVVGPRDAARRARTLELLNAGALNSGADFWHAAFVFQHGSETNDYLLAHTLAVIAAGRGRPDATWIAAATLDRYLQRIGQKQIYGTQFSTPRGQPTTQEPYDRTLVSDALREALGVPNHEGQEQQRAMFDARARAAEAARTQP